MTYKNRYEVSCKEKNCPEKVVYEPDDPGNEIPAMRVPQKITIYLTCPKGHIHPYEVSE